MNFVEAEERYRWLERQRRIRRISMEEYRQALNEIRVTDPEGRLWMLQELTGYWHVWDGDQWRPADPRRMAPPRPPVPPQAPQPQPQVQRPAQAGAGGGGCAKFALYGVTWAVLWTVIAIVAFFLWGREEPMTMAGIGVAAVISAILTIAILAGSWEGQVIEMRSERKRVDDDEGDWHYEDRLYAYIRQPNGKIRKEPAQHGWQVGDYLAKRRGEAWVRKLE